MPSRFLCYEKYPSEKFVSKGKGETNEEMSALHTLNPPENEFHAESIYRLLWRAGQFL